MLMGDLAGITGRTKPQNHVTRGWQIQMHCCYCIKASSPSFIHVLYTAYQHSHLWIIAAHLGRWNCLKNYHAPIAVIPVVKRKCSFFLLILVLCAYNLFSKPSWRQRFFVFNSIACIITFYFLTLCRVGHQSSMLSKWTHCAARGKNAGRPFMDHRLHSRHCAVHITATIFI